MSPIGRRRRVTFSPSMVVAITALVFSLGGTSYAVTKLDARSVGTRELKKKAVGAAQLKGNSINSRKVRNGSLTGDDINEASLAVVPLAGHATVADHAAVADAATRAGVAPALERVYYRAASGTIPPAPDPTSSALSTGTARCDPGTLVVGGGGTGEEGTSIAHSYPDGAGAWTVVMANDDTAAGKTFSVFAVCVPASGLG